MDLATITASVAGICMALCQIPQAWKIYKTGRTSGISIGMQTVMNLGVACWMITGFLLDSIPMWLSNGVCLLFGLYVLIKCIQNKLKKHNTSH